MTVYYTYCSYETDKGLEGLLYIGFRKCPEGKTPETDNYFGSQTSKKNLEFKNNPNKDKVVLGVFDSKEEALAHEIWLHDLHDVAKNPGFANQAKQTSTKFSTAGMTGEKNPMFGKKGKESPNYGKKRDPETCQKISESNKGKRSPNLGKEMSLEQRKRISEAHAGKELSPEHCRNISEAKKGEKNHNFGKKFSPEHCQKISESLKGEKNPRLDRTLYNFENKELGIVEIQVTRYHLYKKYRLDRSHLGGVVKGKYRQHKGWTLLTQDQSPRKTS